MRETERKKTHTNKLLRDTKDRHRHRNPNKERDKMHAKIIEKERKHRYTHQITEIKEKRHTKINER